jgi:hypothetical protein
MSTYGVPDEVVLIIGKIVIEAGRLEACVLAVAEIYHVPDAVNMFVSKLTKEVRNRAKRWGVPEWARCSAAEVIAWTLEVDRVMTERNSRFHANSFSVLNGPDAEERTSAVFQHQRTGERRAATVATFEPVRRDIRSAVSSGVELQLRLMHRISEHAYSRHTASPSGTPGIAMHSGDNPNVARVTDDEIQFYWKEWDAHEHATWPPVP